MAGCSSWTLSRSTYCWLFHLLCIINIWIICASLRNYIFDYLTLWNILFSWLIGCIPSKKITRFLYILNMIRIVWWLWCLILLMLIMIHYILILRSDWNLWMLNIIWMGLISLFLSWIYIHVVYRIWRVRLHIYIILL